MLMRMIFGAMNGLFLTLRKGREEDELRSLPHAPRLQFIAFEVNDRCSEDGPNTSHVAAS
jgi:hypothetical protein